MAIGALGMYFGLWPYVGSEVTWRGVPLEWILGAATLSAVVAFQWTANASWRRSLSTVAMAMAEIALTTAAIEAIGSGVWLHAVISFAFAALPAWLLARWTQHDTHLGTRVLLQSIVLLGLLAGVLPEIVFAATGHRWTSALAGPLSLAMLALPIALYAYAAIAFARAGHGTADPFDPPKRLVSTGPYAWVANPMQLAICLFLVGLGNAVGNP